MSQARLDLIFTQVNLDKITKDLQKIQKIAKNIEVGGDSKQQEDITKEKDKHIKKDEVRLILQTKLLTAEKNGYMEAQKNIKDLIKLNEDDTKISKEKWLTLQKITAEDAKHKRIISDKISLNKQLASETNKSSQKIIKDQEMLYNAYKMNNEFDRKAYQAKVSLEKQHYEAVKMNAEFDKKATDKKIAYDKLHYEALQKNIKLEQQKTETIAQQQHMLAKMSIGRTGSGYEELTKKVKLYNDQLKNGSVLSKAQLRDLDLTKSKLNNAGKSIKNTTNNFADLHSMLRLVNSSLQMANKLISRTAEIDNAVYALGVVSGKSAVEIEYLRKELLEYSAELPISSEKIANSLDIVVRTGRSLAEAQELGAASVQLAVASNEDLAFITSSLAKILVSFKLDTDAAANSVDSLYTAVLKTPLSIQGLSDSMKNSSAAFSSLINFTTKSSEELESYKKNLLELSIASTAKFAEMGKMNAHLKSFDMLEGLKAS